MALNNRRNLALGLADPPIAVPETAYAEARDVNRRSLVGRLLSPGRQDLDSLIEKLPSQWHLDGSRSRGRIIGGGKVQFVFEDGDRDLEMVLWSGPYTFNGWLVVLQKWEDEPGIDFLKSVPVWVRIRGIPIRYLCEGTVREIVRFMGEVMEVELDDTTFDVSSVRVRVNYSVDTKLCFKKVVRFESGETKIVSFGYEDIAHNMVLLKYCHNCGALNHLTSSCSHAWVDVPDPNDRSLSPPPHDASFDGSAENDGEGETSSDDLEQIEPPADDGVQGLPDGSGGEQPHQGLDGVQVLSERVETSSEGSKRKFEEVKEADDILEKRIRGSSDATKGLGINLKPLGEE